MQSMCRVHVINPGFQTTIQDLGRFGYAHLGISSSGAADALSLRIGNLLVGNPEDAPALEMTLVGGEFEFEESSVIALTGSDFEPALNGQSIPLWASVKVRSGERLKLDATKSGARCYLCVKGGFEIPLMLGSCSTHILTTIGGFDGRALKRGDILQTKSLADPGFKPKTIDDRFASAFFRRQEIRVTEGLQSDQFEKTEVERFYSSNYSVSEDSNRMGLRLKGIKLSHSRSPEIITEGAPLGAIQIPQDGEPIVLFVEHQTTGGYPKIANVIAADMHRVGQLRPRDSVRFRKVSIPEALSYLSEQERFIQSVRGLPQ